MDSLCRSRGAREDPIFRLEEILHAKEGEAAFSNTSSGPVGSYAFIYIRQSRTHRMVIQLAKRDRLKVIASAGSVEKVKFMKETGADDALTTKQRTPARCWSTRGDRHDNVGGSKIRSPVDL
ncbi:NADP-dependent oxidoreductase RED1 [Mycena venus]|uniref:NADP-dependent oxidoreductase RED1 n=1 Tax=Mycena venus TaxID=2733690 RepID=A0A8H6XKK8_9AGAR|nr:NADP-dependent oxidoreductase RED1 [Mycena venus]